VLVIFVGAGAFVASAGDPTERSTALAYGMAWEAFAGGILKSGAAALLHEKKPGSNR